MSRTTNIDEKNARARIAAGQVPVLDASYSFKSVFPDGTEVCHQVMSRIEDAHILKAPKCRGQKWIVPSQETAKGVP